MSVSKADIQLIRKYLNGKLDARAMYELELRAQNDPELMDVMQGMELAETDQQPRIDHINELINQRVAKDKKRIVPMFRYWAAAASALALLGIGSWWLTREMPKVDMVDNVVENRLSDKTKTDTTPLIAKIPIPTDNRPQIASAYPTVRKHKVKPAMSVLDSIIGGRDTGLIAANTSKKLEEVVVRGYVRRAREQTTGASYVITGKEVQDNPVANVEQLLQGKVAGVDVKNSARRNQPYYITGKVTDKQDGSPLPGVSINLNGKALTQTDVNGAFSFSTSGQNMLTVNFIGYQSKQFEIDKQRDIKIELNQANNSLAEVVVVGKTVECRENLKFKTSFFEKIALVEKYTVERSSGIVTVVTEKQFLKALKFIARRIAVSIRTDVKNGKGYPDLDTFAADKAQWLQWYEANKCNNLK